MYRIGIIGHTPEYFSDPEATKRLVNQTLDLIQYQYGKEELIINVAGNIGVDCWATTFCSEYSIKYHLFLPCPVEDMKKMFYDYQVKLINQQFTYAWATTISFPKYESPEQAIENYKHIVDNSNFVIYFWNGMKQGNVFDSIKYALSTNVLSINGLDEKKLITNEEIGKLHEEYSTCY